MRLKHVFISGYKNLNGFSIDFDGESFMEVFVGRNGAGKSNFFEALVKIFHHLYWYDKGGAEPYFNYAIKYEIDGIDTVIEWASPQLIVNQKNRKTLGGTPIPDNVLIYYSGHNDTVADLVGEYEDAFRRRIKKADFDESRRFIGIGPEYKELLLSVLLMQKEASKTHQFIRQKLGIKTIAPDVRVVLRRPVYAASSVFDIEDVDADRYWRPEGITKIFLDRLSRCFSDPPAGSLVRTEGYLSSEDRYVLYLNIGKLQAEFSDFSSQDMFRQLDNLKTIGMLAEISIPVRLESGIDATLAHFSDGQFQSIYIYSIAELFKDRNCITLLDEPDSFLHPEWQFDFLKQVIEITDAAVRNNHVLMSSHSASTITTVGDNVINLFEFKGGGVAVTKANKADVIRSLSAGLISFTESEARLNIHHVLKNTTGPVLFSEGITDEIILEVAWSKLYPSGTRRFEIQGAFDRIFLRNLFSRDELKTNFSGRKMFALFDFDEAFDDWNGLREERIEVSDPLKGMAKQLKCTDHYALLLPVPDHAELKKQVLSADGKPWGRGVDSHISIELLFYTESSLHHWFDRRSISGGGELIEFSGDKAKFAKDVVPRLDASCFEIFRPMFEFIESKCSLS